MLLCRHHCQWLHRLLLQDTALVKSVTLCLDSLFNLYIHLVFVFVFQLIYSLAVLILYSDYLFTWCLYWLFSLFSHLVFVLVTQLIYSLGVCIAYSLCVCIGYSLGVCIAYSAYLFTWCLY